MRKRPFLLLSTFPIRAPGTENAKDFFESRENLISVRKIRKATVVSFFTNPIEILTAKRVYGKPI